VPGSANQTPRIVIVGAGMSGLCLAIRLKQAGISQITILEKSSEVGGTWLDNCYPNSGCDVPSFLYSFSFAPKHDWTMKYARQPEILEYFKECADRFEIRNLIQFNTTVQSAVYDETSATWNVTTDSGEQLTSDIFVSAVGQLNRPRTPQLEGLDQFEGDSWHSARWNHDVDLTDKTVAVIGNGASAIQFVPQIADRVRQLYLFQRTPSWIHPLHNYRYPGWAKACFNNIPLAGKAHRLWIYLMCEWRIIAFQEGSLANRIYTWWLRWQMKRLIPRDQWSTLIPDYSPGCKRILLSSDFLQTMQRDNVELVTDSATRFEKNAICTETESRDIDAVIFATGFDAIGFLQPMDIRGRNGVSLHDAWSVRPKTLLGIATPDFPNMFLLYGPNTNLGHNSIIFMVEQQVKYITRCLKHMVANNLQEIEVQKAAVDKYDSDVQKHLSTSVWAGDCSSWYKASDGTIPNNWWGSATAYRLRMRKPDLSLFNFSSPETQNS
jgi:cation diffusion facilitator CzcD-associated flavoprotein CzcO